MAALWRPSEGAPPGPRGQPWAGGRQGSRPLDRGRDRAGGCKPGHFDHAGTPPSAVISSASQGPPTTQRLMPVSHRHTAPLHAQLICSCGVWPTMTRETPSDCSDARSASHDDAVGSPPEGTERLRSHTGDSSPPQIHLGGGASGSSSQSRISSRRGKGSANNERSSGQAWGRAPERRRSLPSGPHAPRALLSTRRVSSRGQRATLSST